MIYKSDNYNLMRLKYLINHILNSNFSETKFFNYSQIVDKLVIKSKLML